MKRWDVRRLLLLPAAALLLTGWCAAAMPETLVPVGSAVGIRLEADGLLVVGFDEEGTSPARADAMQGFREAIAARPEPFLELLAQTERDTGLVLSGETYKRPRPCPDPRLVPYFQLKNLLCCRDIPVDEGLFSPALADEVAGTLRGLLPLYQELQRFF